MTAMTARNRLIELNRENASKARKFLLNKGFLNEEQLLEIENLQDATNPNFVEELFALGFTELALYSNNIEQELKNTSVNCLELDNVIKQINASSSSMGAARVRDASMQMWMYCLHFNVEGCKSAFQKVKNEIKFLQGQMEYYFQLKKPPPFETQVGGSSNN